MPSFRRYKLLSQGQPDERRNQCRKHRYRYRLKHEGSTGGECVLFENLVITTNSLETISVTVVALDKVISQIHRFLAPCSRCEIRKSLRRYEHLRNRNFTKHHSKVPQLGTGKLNNLTV